MYVYNRDVFLHHLRLRANTRPLSLFYYIYQRTGQVSLLRLPISRGGNQKKSRNIFHFDIEMVGAFDWIHSNVVFGLRGDRRKQFFFFPYLFTILCILSRCSSSQLDICRHVIAGSQHQIHISVPLDGPRNSNKR